MAFRSTATSTILAIVLAAPAFAHGPDGQHGPSSTTAKPEPTTCEQLADPRYSSDTNVPAIKALKERCEKEKKSK